MKAWEALTQKENDGVWNQFYAKFVPANARINDFIVPAPVATYSIDAYFCNDEKRAALLENDLSHKTLLAFQGVTKPEEYFYALDWQHDCYRFYPHRDFDFNDPMAWQVFIIPDGDYQFFLNENMTLGLLGHPWKQTISIFGERLITAFAQQQPLLFDDKIIDLSMPV